MKQKAALLVFLSLTLVGCSSTPKLSEAPKSKVDLNGVWLLNEELSDPPMLFSPGSVSAQRSGRSSSGREGRKQRGASGNVGRQHQKESQSNSRADRQLFLRSFPIITANEIKIEQDSTGLGIAFPSSPYRDIDLGEHQTGNKTVVSGWNNEDQLVVVSKNQKMTITETYMLTESPKSLTIEFKIKSPRGIKSLNRVFDFSRNKNSVSFLKTVLEKEQY